MAIGAGFEGKGGSNVNHHHPAQAVVQYICGAWVGIIPSFHQNGGNQRSYKNILCAVRAFHFSSVIARTPDTSRTRDFWEGGLGVVGGWVGK
jgi:hypothetical protein